MLSFYAHSQKKTDVVEKISLGLLLFLLCLIALPFSATAQPEEILTAKKVNRKITFGFHPNDLVNPNWEMRYAIDDDFQWKDSKRFKGVVALAAADEFNILTTFINPLAYRVHISESSSEDPTSKATEEFLEKLVHLFPQAVTSQAPQGGGVSTTSVTPAQLAKTLKQIDKMNISVPEKEKLKITYIVTNPVSISAAGAQNYLSDIHSPELLNLLLWV